MGLIALYIVLALILLWIVIASLMTGISPMPSSKRARKTICELLPKNFRGNLIDLGSGWGDLAFHLAEAFPDSTITGYELSYIPYLISKLRYRHNLHFYHIDFYRRPLDDFQVVVCYLYPEGMDRLKPKLEKELAPGSLVISNTFAITDWTPIKTIELDDLYHTKIYMYERPL